MSDPSVSRSYQRSLCRTFLGTSLWVWNRRATAKRIGFKFSEETITETILLHLATRHPTEIGVAPFNKRQEGKNGSDWEWCFYTPGKGFVRMLIQAKALDDNDRNYAHLDHEVGSTGVLQNERLIETAQRLGIPALYMFYNHLHDAKRLPRTTWTDECWGISMAFADSICGVLPKKSFDLVKGLSRPWAALVCSDEDNLLASVIEALSELRDMARDADDATLQGSKERFRLPQANVATNGLPSYVTELEELSSMAPGRARLRFIEDMAVRYPGRDGIVTVRQRQSDGRTIGPTNAVEQIASTYRRR